MSVVAIVPAAGSGRRFGRRAGKLFATVHRVPLLVHTLRALQASPAIRWILLAVRPDDAGRIRALIVRHRITKALPPVTGGASRAASVARAFAQLPAAARWVLIHDGARPCVSAALITRTVRAAKRHGAVVCGLPASGTVKTLRGQAVSRTLDRDTLWFAQTPQVFRRDWFGQALRQVNGTLTRFPDDAALVERAGFRVRVVPGDPLNVKVTTPQDLVLARAVLRRR